MELRGQEKEIGMPSTLGYNSSPKRDSSSSSKLTSPSLGLGERIRDEIVGDGNTIFNHPPQTLEHHSLPFQSHFQPLDNIPQQHQQKSRNQIPDPVPTPISTASAKLITASGSNFKTPPPLPPSSTAINAAGGTIPAPSPPPPPPSSSSGVRYRECLKNHAATTGGHILDGCGEFMPGGDEGSSDSLKCAACECHRNFHRKEIDGESRYVPNSYYSYNPNKDINGRRSSIATTTIPPPLQIPPQPHLHHHHQQQQHQHQHQRFRHYNQFSHGVSTSTAAAGGGPMPPMMMAFGGAAAESSSEDLNMFRSNNYGVGGQGSVVVLQQQPSASKKRFRTKFSQPQKEKMMEFAEKLGWKIQKHDEQEVLQFCSEVGVKRKAFKVWMHNNKQTMKKKEEV